MSNSEADIRFSELVSFLKNAIREYNKPINRETIIEDDLGVTGDDAEQLIIAFGKRFGVDIRNFEFSKYFYDEPGIFNYQNRIVKPFKVGYLEKAILAGRLDEEVINS